MIIGPTANAWRFSRAFGDRNMKGWRFVRTSYQQEVAQAMQQTIRYRSQAASWTVPVPIHTLLRQSELWVVEATISLPRFEAALVPPLVVVNHALSAFAQRFALAHEAIHAWYHEDHWDQLRRATADYAEVFEIEANAGAAELLLPYEWFNDLAATYVGARLHTEGDLREFLASPEAKRWAGQARVTVPVLGYHLQDLGWVGPQMQPVSPVTA